MQEISKTIGVFELGRLLLLPGIRSRLNVFEPRYTQLLNDALKSDRRIALGVLAGEDEKTRIPGLKPQGCIGRIEECRRMEDASFRIVVLGETEVGFLHEVPSRRDYRRCVYKVKAVRSGRSLAEVSMLPGLHRLMDWIVENATTPDARTWSDSMKQKGFEELTNQLCLAFPFGEKEQNALMSCEGGLPRAHLLMEFSSELFQKDFMNLEKTIH